MLPRTQSWDVEAGRAMRERQSPSASISGSQFAGLRSLVDRVRHPLSTKTDLANWLGVSEGRVSQMMHNPVDTWGLVERRGKRGETRYTLSAEGIRYASPTEKGEN